MAKAKSISKKDTKPVEKVAEVVEEVVEVAKPKAKSAKVKPDESMSEIDILKVLARTQGVDQTASDGSIVKQDGSVIVSE